MRYPVYKQDNLYSCGVYALAMILAYYHIYDEIANIKYQAKLTNQGVSIYGLVQALKHYNIEAKAYQADFKTFCQEATFPCIAYVTSNQVNHYVVVYKKIKDGYLIGDPAIGLVKKDVLEFKATYNKICVLIEHVGRSCLKLRYLTFWEFLSRHLKIYYSYIIKLTCLSGLLTLMSLVGATYYQQLFDRLLKLPFLLLVSFTLVYSLIMLLKTYLTYFKEEYVLSIKKEFDYHYVTKMIMDSVYLRQAYFKQISTGNLLTAFQNLFLLSDFFIRLYTAIFSDGVLIIIMLIALFYLSSVIGLVTLIACLLLGIISNSLFKKLNELNKNVLLTNEEVNQMIVEYDNNFYTINQFNLRRYFKDKASCLLDVYIESKFKKDRYFAYLGNLLEGYIQVLTVVAILIASYLFKINNLSVGTVMIIYLLLGGLVQPLLNIVSLFVQREEVVLIFERYKQLIPQFEKGKKKIKRINRIRVDHITYSYNYQKPVISQLDLILDRSTLIKGDIGSGKSTLLKLIAGVDFVQEGDILINNLSIKEINLASYYRHLIYLDHHPKFFNESLRFNIELDQRNAEVEKLMVKFKLEYLISYLDQQIDINNNFLSSGQQQEVILLRALIQKPDFLVLDEALCNVQKDRRWELLRRVRRDYSDLKLIVVDHEIKEMEEGFDYVIIDRGKIKR